MSLRRLHLLPAHSLAARLVVCLTIALLGQGAAIARADTPTGDPSANRPLSTTTLEACQNDPASQDCISSALADINAARASEGVGPMTLPSGFASFTVPQQLLVLADLERVPRGLIPVLGLSAPLNQDAAAGAAADGDPTPTNWYGDSYASNWAGGFPSTLEADFAWMYDDGQGSGNLDCTSTNTSGCWGHRHDILMAFDAPLVMGAAETSGQYGPSMAELFVGGDTETAPGHADQPLAPTWASITGAPSRGSGSTSTSGSGSTGTGSHSAGGQTTVIAVPGAGSRPATVAAFPRIVLARVPGRVARGRRIEIWGAVTPAGHGRRAQLERWTGHGWARVASTTLDAGSWFGFRVRAAGRGRLRLRVVLTGAGGVASRAVGIRIIR